MELLLELVEKHLGAGWRELADWLREQNSIGDIEARIERGDYDGAVSDLKDAALKFAATSHDAYLLAAKQTATWLDDQLPSALIHFDATNDRSIARAKQNQLELVHGISDEQRESINQVLRDGAKTGANPREMARDIRDSIGLTPEQEAAVRSYRAAIEGADWSNALGRELSDGRSDQTLRRLQRDGGSVPQSQLDTMVERYRQNMLTYRATNIARTEGLKVAHQGNDDAFRQAIDRGDIRADQLAGQWNPGPRTRYARPDHRARSLLEQRPAYGKPFVLPDGSRMMYPGDPAGGAENCANCRCNRSFRLVA